MHPFLEAVYRLHRTRITALTGAKTIGNIFFLSGHITQSYLRLLDELSPIPTTSRAQPRFYFRELETKVKLVIEDFQRGYKEMALLIQDATETVGAIRSHLERGSNSGTANHLLKRSTVLTSS